MSYARGRRLQPCHHHVRVREARPIDVRRDVCAGDVCQVLDDTRHVEVEHQHVERAVGVRCRVRGDEATRRSWVWLRTGPERVVMEDRMLDDYSVLNIMEHHLVDALKIVRVLP